jgi:hypothetical protein
MHPSASANACASPSFLIALQALAEAAAAEQSKQVDATNPSEHSDAALAMTCSTRLRQLFCLSRCLLGRLVEWRAESDACQLYNEAVRVCPCFESCYQMGRLMLKMAANQQQLEAAQKARTFCELYRRHVHSLCSSDACSSVEL